MVVIKDFDMPNRCIYCDFCHYDEDYGRYDCLLTNECVNDIVKVQRDKNCPLVEIEQSEDCVSLYTQGLDEGIRCAMCTNSMKSDSGCDGGCVVNERMYKKVMDIIHNHTFRDTSAPTHGTCKE